MVNVPSHYSELVCCLSFSFRAPKSTLLKYFLEYILYHSHIISSFSLDILCLEPVFLNIEATNCLCVVLHGDIYLKRIYEDLDRKKWPIILQYRF